jgi:hypothetical protein
VEALAMKSRVSHGAFVVLIGLVASLGAGLVMSYRPVRAIEFRPNVIIPNTLPIEGELVRHKLVLFNPNSFAVRLGTPRSSCGCSSLIARSTKQLAEGEVLGANASLELVIEIRTGGQVGTRLVQVEVPATTMEGRPVPGAHARIDVPVKTGPRISPMALVFRDILPGQSVSQELRIADGQDTPVHVTEVKFSDPKHFAARVIGVDPNRMDSESPMKHVQKVIVTYCSAHPPAMGNEFVEVVLEPSRFAPLRVPIYLRASQDRPRFVPERLVLVSKPGQAPITRTVYLRTCGRQGSVRIVRCPSFIKVEIGKQTQEEVEVNLGFDMAALAQAVDGQELVVALDDGIELSLPVKALSIRKD